MMTMVLEKGQSDQTLAASAAAGDRDAFSALIERHYDFIFRVAWRLTGNRAEAEDLAQEVCVRVGRAIGSFRGQGALTTWLYALTLNAVRDLARKSARERARATAYGVHALIAGEAVEAVDDPAEALWEAVRRLPEKQRDAVTLVYGENLSHLEAAQAMNCAEATVSWHIHEAKKRLKAMLSAGDEP
jgi:RNA polymerase sigma-70 factor (ECF subfamily)